jgi:predicted nucleic acid-binding protein
MKIVIDSNIVFSAILNSQGKIAQLIINGSNYFSFFSINLLKKEILNHKHKLLSISGLTETQFESSFSHITSRIKFVDEILISDQDLERATKLTRDIDENDILFVALTNHLSSKLWTGDKKLSMGLKKKKYFRIISTNELYDLFIEKELRKRKP